MTLLELRLDGNRLQVGGWLCSAWRQPPQAVQAGLKMQDHACGFANIAVLQCSLPPAVMLPATHWLVWCSALVMLWLAHIALGSTNAALKCLLAFVTDCAHVGCLQCGSGGHPGCMGGHDQIAGAHPKGVGASRHQEQACLSSTCMQPAGQCSYPISHYVHAWCTGDIQLGTLPSASDWAT